MAGAAIGMRLQRRLAADILAVRRCLLMLVIMVAKVLRGLPILMLAIACRSHPGELEQQGKQH